MATIIFGTNSKAKETYKNMAGKRDMDGMNYLEMMLGKVFLSDNPEGIYNQSITDNIIIPYYGGESYKQLIVNKYVTDPMMCNLTYVKNEMKHIHACLRTYDKITILSEVIELDDYDLYHYSYMNKPPRNEILDRSYIVAKLYAKEIYLKMGFYCTFQIKYTKSKVKILLLFLSRNVSSGLYYFNYDSIKNFKTLTLKNIIASIAGFSRYITFKTGKIEYEEHTTKTKLYKIENINHEFIMPAIFPISNYIYRGPIRLDWDRE